MINHIRNAGFALTPKSRMFSIIAFISLFIFLNIFPAHAEIVQHAGNISAQTTWSAGDVHQITGDITVDSDVQLTIEPGAIVKFNQNTALTVNGILVATGNESEKIIFTSYRDDSIGGDTNGDGASSGQPGDWVYIRFTNSVIDSLTTLDHVEVRYSGSNSAAILQFSANVDVTNSVVRDSATDGIGLYDSYPLIENNNISRNVNSAIHLESEYGQPQIINNRLSNSKYGIYSANYYQPYFEDGMQPIINGNTITGNSDWGIYFNSDHGDVPVIKNNIIIGNGGSVVLPATAMPNSTDNNTLLPNTKNYIILHGWDRKTDLHLEVLRSGNAEINTYQISTSHLRIFPGATLTIDPGVNLKFDDSLGLDIFGAINAQGTAQNRIVLTSSYDNTVGAKTLNGVLQNGLWARLYIGNNATSANLAYTDIRYAGANAPFGGASDAALSVYEDVAASNLRISRSGDFGIRIQSNAQLTLSDSEIYGNGDTGIFCSDNSSLVNVTNSRIYANGWAGLFFTNDCQGAISNNEIFGNTGVGIYNGGSQVISAEGNWWGSVDGPSGAGPGSGEGVSSRVNYDGWLTDGSVYSYFNAGRSITIYDTAYLSTGKHEAHGLSIGNVSGTPSIDFGFEPNASFLYETDLDVPIQAYFTGLNPATTYRVLFTYIYNDNGSGTQYVTDTNGNQVHGNIELPRRSSIFDYRLAKSAYSDGSLNLNIHRESGLRTVISELFLIEDASTDSVAPSIALTSPVNEQLLMAGTNTVSGTVMDNTDDLQKVEIGISTMGASTQWHMVSSVSNDGSWQYQWTENVGGSYQLSVRAMDISGNQQASLPINVSIDSTAPRAVSNVILQNLSGGIRALWTLSSDDGSGQNDVVRYDILRRKSSDLDFILLGQVGSGVGIFDDTTVELGSEYSYLIRSVDRAGHQTNSSTVAPIVTTLEDDFVAPEDVTNLSVQTTHVNGENVSAYLTWTGSENTAEDWASQRLYISLEGSTTFGTNSPLFDDGQFIPMSVAARQQIVTELSIGQVYHFRITTLDGVPNESVGTSVSVSATGATNEYVSLSGSLSSDTILTAGVYVITNDLDVPDGITLTLQPGTILKFKSSKYLNVEGNIDAAGSSDAPITFTAFTDDSIGGDTNDDGVSVGTPGYWRHIRLNNKADSTLSRLDYVTVKFGGKFGGFNFKSTSIYLIESHVPITNSLIQYGNGYGIYASDSNSLIHNNRIEAHQFDGVYLPSGAPSIEGNIITGNRIGINVGDAAVVGIHNNTITQNSSYGIYFNYVQNTPTITGNVITENNIALRVPASALPDNTNVLTQNVQPYIYVLANTLQSDVTLSIWNEGLQGEIDTYIISGDWIRIPEDKTLTIDPGVIMKFQAAGIASTGRLIANGTEDKNITFTSYRDLTVGANADANELAQPGDWYGLSFSDSLFEAQNILNHSVVRYGNSVYAYESDITIKNSIISNNFYQGIYVYNSSPTITGNDIWGNRSNGIYIRNSYANPIVSFNRISSNLNHGIYLINDANATLTNNLIYLNRNYGIYNDTSNRIDASSTWWGDTDGSGPYHTTTNATGTGDEVSNSVTYTPFVTTQPFDYNYRNFSTRTPDTIGNLNAITLDQGTLSDEWDSSLKRSDRTMAWDTNTVQVSTTGLNPSKRYKLRVSYFNGDPRQNYQSLTDSKGNPFHGSVIIPKFNAVQYEYRIPQTYYTDGNLVLHFHHDNPDTSIRGALPELWLFEEIVAVIPPLFSNIVYNDVDGSRDYTVGDTFSFYFSKRLDVNQIVTNSTDANDKLTTNTNAIYGTNNTLVWDVNEQVITVTLTDGFTVVGGETINPISLSDDQGNAVVGSQILSRYDTGAPVLNNLTWQDNDNDEAISLGDSFTFFFSEAMNANALVNGSTDVNTHLRPQSGNRYGTINSLTWATDFRSVTVDITTGFTVVGDELVIPSSVITDIAGNSVTGIQYLLGKNSDDPLDSDNDDLPDAWEIENFGNLDHNGTGDFDNDGVPNELELFYDTDPDQTNVALPELTLSLKKGVQIIGVPGLLVPQISSHDLLQLLGTATRSISRYNTTTQLQETTYWDNANPAGPDFYLWPNEGYFVQMLEPTDLVLTPFDSNKAIPLQTGINVIGLTDPAGDAFGLLDNLGSDLIWSIRRLNPITALYETAAFDDVNKVGVPFPMRTGEGYIVIVKQDGSLGSN